MRFEVLIGEVVVGETDLERGDAPMGVAFGEFVPNAQYAGYERLADKDGFIRPPDEVSVRSKSGEILRSPVGTCIQDLTKEIGEPAREVSILGMHWQDYEKWFPNHVAYEKVWREKLNSET